MIWVTKIDSTPSYLELSLSELSLSELSLSELSLSELESELSDESLSELESLEELELEERPRLRFTFLLLPPSEAAAAAGRRFVTAPLPLALFILSSRSAFLLGNGAKGAWLMHDNISNRDNQP